MRAPAAPANQARDSAPFLSTGRLMASRPLRGLGIAALLCAVLGVLPTSASGAVAGYGTRDGKPILFFQGGGEEANRLKVDLRAYVGQDDPNDRYVTFADAGAEHLTAAGFPCTKRRDPPTVRCRFPNGLSDNVALSIELGKGSDTVQVRECCNQATIDGGAGADDLRAGGEADFLKGGEGADTLHANGVCCIQGDFNGDQFDVLSGGPGVDTVAYDVLHTFGPGQRQSANVTLDNVGNDTYRVFLEPTLETIVQYHDDVRDDVENIEGTIGDDVLVAPIKPAHANRIRGGFGLDYMNGGAGDDELVGGGELLGGSGDDSLTGPMFSLQAALDGGKGDDVLTGGAGSNILTGGAGSDRMKGLLRPCPTAQCLDRVSYEGTSLRVRVTMDGKPNDGASGEGDNVGVDVEAVEGGNGNDQLAGNGAENTLTGGAGDDTLDGSGRKDRLIGGPGRDTASYANHDRSVRLSLDDEFNDGAHGENDLINDDVENLIGGWGRDRLIGRDSGMEGEPRNVLDGGPGSDRLFGLGGDDDLRGGSRRDTLIGGADDDTLSGGSGDDRVLGGDGNDRLVASGGLLQELGSDELSGGAGADTVDYGGGSATSVTIDDRANDGRRILLSGSGGDRGQRGAALERDNVKRDNEIVVGSSNADRLTGGSQPDELHGAGGSDRLAGEAENDLLYGEAGDDTLLGGAGGDLLDGAAGSDTLTGGSETDFFICALGFDRVLDRESTESPGFDCEER